MKSKLKEIISVVFLISVSINVCSYAGVNGGTEDIIAPTASPYERMDDSTSYNPSTSGGRSGYNTFSGQTYRSPLDPMGAVANVGVSPSGLISNIAYETSTGSNISQLNGMNINTNQDGVIVYEESGDVKKGTSVESQAAILVNATTKKIYYGKNYNITHLPAGLGNLMTAYLAIKHLNIDDVLEVHTSAVKGVDKDAAIAALNNGDTIVLKDALAALFVKGCVDCANVIAENVSGSIDAFVELMNTTAKELGCQNTTFKNPSGLDATGQATTAYDIAIIMDKLTEYDVIVELMGLTEYKLPKVSRRGELMLYSKNTMLSKDSHYYNAGINCSRLGYTKNAEYTMASEFMYGKNKFIAVILKSKGTYYADTRKLYEYAQKAFEEGK